MAWLKKLKYFCGGILIRRRQNAKPIQCQMEVDGVSPPRRAKNHAHDDITGAEELQRPILKIDI
jgi:hypothetical protein